MREASWSWQDYVDWWGYRVLRRVPVSAVSTSGAVAARVFAAFAAWQEPPWWRGMAETIGEITGEQDAGILARRRLNAICNIGRIRFEFASLERLYAAGRVAITGTEHLRGLRTPAVFVGCHLGNWETIGIGLAQQGVPITALYDPPALPADEEIVVRARAAIPALARGSRLVRASPNAARDLVRAVDAGENVLIYVDEYKDELVWAPALGRALPDRGNRILAARLALRGGGDVVPIRTRRHRGQRYEIAIQPPLRFSPAGETRRDARALGDLIAATIEPWIVEDLDQWFWLPYLALGKRFDHGASL